MVLILAKNATFNDSIRRDVMPVSVATVAAMASISFPVMVVSVAISAVSIAAVTRE